MIGFPHRVLSQLGVAARNMDHELMQLPALAITVDLDSQVSNTPNLKK
jgi:hypothetical protein